MPNGKPIRSDLDVLRAFRDVPAFDKEERFTRLGITQKQLWTILRKARFAKWMEYTWDPNNGWLTEEGEAELARLEALHNRPR